MPKLPVSLSETWTNVTPGITGASAIIVNISDKDQVVRVRVQEQKPDDADIGGLPMRASEGLLKEQLADLTYDTSNLTVWARVVNGTGLLWAEYV